MMKIKIITIGKNEVLFNSLFLEYEKRLLGMIDIETIYLKDVKVSNSDIERIKIEEGDKIIQSIPVDFYKVALSENGKSFTSLTFAQKIETIRDFEGGKICFIIGGAFGLSQDVLDACDLVLSLSDMTFTHQMARVILIEQIYRALQILQGTGYHK